MRLVSKGMGCRSRRGGSILEAVLGRRAKGWAGLGMREKGLTENWNEGVGGWEEGREEWTHRQDKAMASSTHNYNCVSQVANDYNCQCWV